MVIGKLIILMKKCAGFKDGIEGKLENRIIHPQKKKSSRVKKSSQSGASRRIGFGHGTKIAAAVVAVYAICSIAGGMKKPSITVRETVGYNTLSDSGSSARTGSTGTGGSLDAVMIDDEPVPESASEPVAAYTIDDVPAYSGEDIIVVNGCTPFFSDTEKGLDGTQFVYGGLDSLGRTLGAFAVVSKDTLNDSERTDISSIRPSGWWQESYDFIPDGYLYQRSHVIMRALGGADSAVNLITGTYTLNESSMLTMEGIVYDAVSGNPGIHVLYRVTPLYEGENLLCDGVLMEAYSVEDDGESVSFCVFCYNVQDGVDIDYVTGCSWESR